MPKKYEGLDGTELAISESQERMAVVVDAEKEDRFINCAAEENLEAVAVATVTDENRVRMYWRGKCILDLSRDFLNTNGAQQFADVLVKASSKPAAQGLAASGSCDAAIAPQDIFTETRPKNNWWKISTAAARKDLSNVLTAP